MRSKKPFLIAIFLGVWIIATYLLLTRQGIDNVDQTEYRELLRSLNRLEVDIKEETLTGHELIQRLLVAVKEVEKVCWIN